MHARGFRFSDDLYQITSPDFGIYQLVAQLDGRYTYLYTDLDSYEPLAQVHNHTNAEGESH